MTAEPTSKYLHCVLQDLEARLTGAADSVRHFQGVTVADQFRDGAASCIDLLKLRATLIEQTAACGSEDALRGSIAATREQILEAMAAARGSPPANWYWPTLAALEHDE